MMMEAVIYGIIPSENSDTYDSAPPEKRLSNAIVFAIPVLAASN